MEKNECISLCEVMEHIHSIEPQFEKVIENVSRVAGYSKCERIYIGSSFCGQYFLHLSESLIEQLMKVCQEKALKVTLVLPIFTQKNLKKGKDKIAHLLNCYQDIIDEITVNDYGMLFYIRETYKKIGINLGRLFMKDYREPRYEEYFNSVLKPRGFTNYLKDLIKQYQIKGIEFDPTHKIIDFSEKPESVEIGIYAPYAYITVGQICEVGSISKPVEKKFRPNEPCGLECYKHRMRYFMEDSRDWRRIGKAIYFENKAPEIRGVSHAREIYAPLDWEVEV
ncbi:MAG: hypothetical protein J6F30_15935 [Cellulosilyticum sp.]|nr:hypothetical protein [Cellulosilyticum sp.]